MMARTLAFLVFVVTAAAAAVGNDNLGRRYHDVDPNTLSCDPHGKIFLLLPHFTDCTKFMMCAHGEEVEFDCAEPLIFDFERQTCNWNWGTKCWLRDLIDEEGSGSGYELEEEIIGKYAEEAENEPIAILNAASTKQFNVILNCNRAESASQQVAYKGDCQRYWKCVEGVPQTAYCTDGLFFNKNTQQCDFEANSLCTLDQADELQGEFIVYENH